MTASPRGPLYRPAVGQRVRAAPLTLAWDAVPGARFYNVQLFRNGVKVLSSVAAQADAAGDEGLALRGQDAATRARQLPLVRLARAGDARAADLRPAARPELIRGERGT